MTEQELQTVVAAVIQALKTNGKTIDQLTSVQTLQNSDCFEVSGGRKVSYEVLLDLLSDAIVIDTDGITADIANVVIQSVSFSVTGSTATLSIKQQGYDAKTVSVPVATDSQSGIITAADKVKLDSAYTTANSAAAAASGAQSTANQALTAAASAQTDASNAATAASNAQTAADVAQDAADAAQAAAEAAQKSADGLSEAVGAMKKYGYKFIGVATPTTDPGTPSENVFYLATTEGDYTHFPTNVGTDEGPIYFHLGADEVAILRYTKPTDDKPIITNWSKVTLNLAKGTAITEIRTAIKNMEADITDLEDSIAPRLFFNGNVLTGTDGENLSLAQFVALTAGTAFAFARKKGVVVTLSTADGLKNYQWKGTTWNNTDDWRNFGGSAAVGNCYNVTNEASDLLPPGTGYFTLSTAIAAVKTKGVQGVGMQITFASGANTWKTYQYVGADVTDANFENIENGAHIQ